METFVVTHIRKGSSALAQLLKRNGYYSAHVVQKTNVVCEGEQKPWGILAGYMTSDTQIVPVSGSKESVEDAISRYG